MEAGEICVRAPTYSCSSKHTCRDQEDWTSNSLINTFLKKNKKIISHSGFSRSLSADSGWRLFVCLFLPRSFFVCWWENQVISFSWRDVRLVCWGGEYTLQGTVELSQKYWYRKTKKQHTTTTTHIQSRRRECVKQQLDSEGPEPRGLTSEWWLRWSQRDVYRHNTTRHRNERTLSPHTHTHSVSHTHLYTCTRGCAPWLDRNGHSIVPSPDLTEPTGESARDLIGLQCKIYRAGSTLTDKVRRWPRPPPLRCTHYFKELLTKVKQEQRGKDKRRHSKRNNISWGGFYLYRGIKLPFELKVCLCLFVLLKLRREGERKWADDRLSS